MSRTYKDYLPRLAGKEFDKICEENCALRKFIVYRWVDKGNLMLLENFHKEIVYSNTTIPGWGIATLAQNKIWPYWKDCSPPSWWNRMFNHNKAKYKQQLILGMKLNNWDNMVWENRNRPHNYYW